MTGNTYPSQLGSSDSSRADDSGSGSAAEGQAQKRLQRTSPERDVSIRRPDVSTQLPRSATEPQLSFNSQRRQSIRDHKVPQGPRAVQRSPSKRYAPDNASHPVVAPNRPSSSKVSAEAHSRQPSINKSSRFSSASTTSSNKDNEDNTASSFDFFSSLNFDDLHTSLTPGGPSLSEFPAPGGGGSLLDRGTNGRRIISNGTGEKPGLNGIGPTSSPSKIARSGSLLQRQSSNSQRLVPATANMEIMGPPSVPLAPRARRQSHFPAPVAGAAVSRPPRKSIRPGAPPTDAPEEATPRRKISIARSNFSKDLSDAGILRHGTDRSSSGSREGAQVRAPRVLTANRDIKAKSLLSAPQFELDYLATSPTSPDQSRPASINAARSPGRSTGPRTNTPLSSKRMSTMAPHATGLGARTISPTDARRMKRMSIMPNPAPMPQTPPTPQPDPSFSKSRSTTSPSIIPQKSVTPSSARTTPDPSHKSIHSVSTSSNTSYNSCRTSSGSTQPRIPQSSSMSRLPTPRARSETTSNVGEEEVPPVPAIPKAYDSPKYDIEGPYFSFSRKSSLHFDTADFHDSLTLDCVPNVGLRREPSKVDRETRQRKGLTMGPSAEVDRKPVTNTHNSKRNLQPLRLPPLNLLPLSTPTAAKIAALHDEPPSANPGAVTPPPRSVYGKGPSTPMTASRAGFFSRSHTEGEALSTLAQLRSSSSQHALRSAASSYRTAASPSSVAPGDTENADERHAISPYISSSLPKNSAEFGQLRPKTLGEYNTCDGHSETRSTQLTGPRALFPPKQTKLASVSQSSSPVEPETPSFGTSLRRKLSWSRRRSSSRTQASAERNAEYPPQPPKHDGMPPPRLPASATWSGPFLPIPSPTQKSKYLYARRNISNSSSILAPDQTRDDAPNLKSAGTIETGPPPAYSSTPTSSKPVASALGSLTKSLSSKASLGSMKARGLENQLDRDDLLAEEEMKRLASKRKDSEKAAKEVDDLRRKAIPKERVSPTQALKMANLNIFERGEIVDYKEVFFCGIQNARKHVGDLSAEAANFGYDDERGDYNIVNGDHLAYRYEIVDVLGKGSFGQVVRCIDHKNGSLVAIKIIRNKKRFHQQALVEVDLLQKLRDWDPQNKHSMVIFTQSFYFRGHLCISTELLGMNLYEFIKYHDFRGFSLKLIKRFTKQLLNSLILLKSHKVIHCDLKPENILLAHPAHSEIKVIDFGSSCLENEKVYTYIQSRFYRSPEVILGMTYGMPIDMWSLGCILAELLTGFPIFPGENEQEQLACIMEVFGPPEKHLIEKSTRKKLFFDSLGKPRLTVSSKGKRRRPSSKSLQQALKCDDDAFLDFISRCLRWDPDRRLKPDEAILHEFITGQKPKPPPTRTRPPVATFPIKRYHSMQTSTAAPAAAAAPAAPAARPLPEPPATSFKNGAAMRPRDVVANGSSPIKPATAAAARRQSNVNALVHSANAAGVKRALNGAAVAGTGGAALQTRGAAAARRPDMAAAAAAVSL
ncbi:dual specificity tyrosine-phosphorylation regulated kinase 2 [Lasallia pustulata]|uniref:Dual specificity tyrosine-phosphorylation regulated kinase 2 n=1 Tax=Lasallia pustulata TaxID=136370 RepID=A0A1W5CWC1_9LECA|nr:dual specificity tyrosine-phosphorylation regulated kinase 2 [Lasallia pustulata]